MLKTITKYDSTHIGTYRYKCLKTPNGKFPLKANGNYESLLSFKELPPFEELKSRKWKFTKNYYPVMDRIVLDIDCPGGLINAFTVTKSIMQDLREYKDCINVYFSGSKGFHIEILTSELDIIDTSVNRPMDSCYQYVNFLNYFNDKYNEVDLNLKDISTRVIRKTHTKHEKTGNYKILIDTNSDLNTILEHSHSNIDMVKPKTKMLSKEQALKLLNTYSKEVESESNNADLRTDDSIFSLVYNELNTNIHMKILLIASGLNGYVDKPGLMQIYKQLAETTDIEESVNAKGSFIEAYENDNFPCNMGALRNHYTTNNLDLTNFNKLSSYLELKLQTNAYDRFNEIMANYDNWFNMLDSELYDYVDNTKNIFVGVINGLMALFGYGSRNIVVNGGAEVGKSEYMNTIKKLMPRFENLGSSTPASVRRQSEYAFDKKIIYLGDKGLKGKSQNSKEEFEGLQEVFGGLITEKEFKRDIVHGDKILNFNLKSEGVCVFYSEPYTNLRIFGAGDQYTTRSTFITVNPVEDGLSLFLQDENKTNGFYEIHKNYIRYILNNPITLQINSDVKTELYNASDGSLRTAKYLLALFKSYCQYLRISNPGLSDVEDFLKVFKIQIEVTDIEFMIYKKLYQNLNVLTFEDLEYKICEDGTVYNNEDILLQVKNRKEKSFFTAKQIKTYFKQDFKRNKNLKDTLDQVPEILNNLYNANYLNKIEWQYNNQNLYYIPYNADMEK